jgi:hypothetical protein
MLGPWLQGSERFRALTLWTNVTHFLQDDLSTWRYLSIHRMILLIGYSTIPQAPAALSRGIR